MYVRAGVCVCVLLTPSPPRPHSHQFFAELGVVLEHLGLRFVDAFHFLFITVYNALVPRLPLVVAFFDGLGVSTSTAMQQLAANTVLLVQELVVIAPTIRYTFDSVFSNIAPATWDSLNDVAVCWSDFPNCVCDSINLPCS